MEDFDLELDELELVAAAAGYHYYTSITRQPARGLSSKGSGFMNEVLHGNDDLCREMFRMDCHRDDWLFSSVEGIGEVEDAAGVVDELADDLHQSGFSIHEQVAASHRDSIAAAMWNDFMNKWDE
ncbi:DNA replication protein DnaC, partial [Striga asiatica]